MKLTSHEFRVLSYLMHHRDRVVSQGELTEHIYAQDFDRESNTVEVFIARLRRKLGASIIETVRGLGYRIATMTPSLRRRILVGSILWTIGMILLASAAFSKAMELHHAIGFNRSVHAWLQAPLTLLTAASLHGGRRAAGAPRAGAGGQPAVAAGRAHAGQDRRVDGEYPGEIQPLVNDLNALLEHRERAVQRAVAKAGDLAHGLKTPLTILAQEAERANAAGQTDSPTRSVSRSIGCAGRWTTTSPTRAPRHRARRQGRDARSGNRLMD